MDISLRLPASFGRNSKKSIKKKQCAETCGHHAAAARDEARADRRYTGRERTVRSLPKCAAGCLVSSLPECATNCKRRGARAHGKQLLPKLRLSARRGARA